MKRIYNKDWYTPMEIAKLGLIQNRKGDEASVVSTYQYVLNLIKNGQLEARNYSHGDQRQYWLVSETQIDDFHRKFES